MAVALVAVAIVFTIVSPNHVFLSAENLVNLFDQSAVFIVLAMGEGFVLLLGEIDLSIGYVAAIGGIVAADLVQPDQLAVVGGDHRRAARLRRDRGDPGYIITRLRMPAFVVTLAGYLLWFGVMIIILGTAGGVSITSTVLPNQVALYGIVYAYIEPLSPGSAWW